MRLRLIPLLALALLALQPQGAQAEQVVLGAYRPTTVTCVDPVSNLLVSCAGTGGGGGGGGAVTAAIGAYATGSLASGAIVDLGAQADAACGTDNGTCTLIALLKRNNQRITSSLTGITIANTTFAATVADGSDSTEGAKADAAWTSGSGSVIALLKAIAAVEVAGAPVHTIVDSGPSSISANQGAQGAQQWLFAFRDKPTYSSTVIDLVPAAGATDFWTITGSGTKTGRIVSFRVSCVSTAGGPQALTLLRRSTADSSGTSSSPTIGQSLSSDAAATLTVKAYTVSPTTGTLAANLRSSQIMCGTAATGEIAAVPLTFGEDVINAGRPMSLLSTSELFAFNYEGNTPPAGTKFRITEVHSEE